MPRNQYRPHTGTSLRTRHFKQVPDRDPAVNLINGLSKGRYNMAHLQMLVLTSNIPEVKGGHGVTPVKVKESHDPHIYGKLFEVVQKHQYWFRVEGNDRRTRQTLIDLKLPFKYEQEKGRYLVVPEKWHFELIEDMIHRRPYQALETMKDEQGVPLRYRLPNEGGKEQWQEGEEERYWQSVYQAARKHTPYPWGMYLKESVATIRSMSQPVSSVP